MKPVIILCFATVVLSAGLAVLSAGCINLTRRVEKLEKESNDRYAAETPAAVQWSGHPVTATPLNDEPSPGWSPALQVGYRTDGVVVWRRAEERKPVTVKDSDK